MSTLVLGVLGAALIGVILSTQTKQSMVRTVARQVGIAVGAAAITYAIGSAVGVQA